jgi:hypothetical protein
MRNRSAEETEIIELSTKLRQSFIWLNLFRADHSWLVPSFVPAITKGSLVYTMQLLYLAAAVRVVAMFVCAQIVPVAAVETKAAGVPTMINVGRVPVIDVSTL